MTKITYIITGKCQKEELLAGRNASANREIEIDLSSCVNEKWVVIDKSGNLDANGYNSGSISGQHRNNIIEKQESLLTPELALTKLKGEMKEYINAEIAAGETYTKKKKEEKRIVDEWDNKYTPLVVSYENGGTRPTWSGLRWLGTDSLLNRICKVDKKIQAEKDAEIDARKVAQLAEVVNVLGTETQKKKWAAGMMARKEALDILWNKTFANPLEKIDQTTYRTDEYIHDQCAKYPNADWEQSAKETITDSEFENLEEIKGLFLACDFSTMKEFDKNENEESLTYVHITKTIGEYSLSCDVIIS